MSEIQLDYAKPKLLNEALDIISKSINPYILAGGTDLIDMIKEGLVQPDMIIDLKGIEQFHQLSFKNDALFIGAGVTFSELIESKIIKEHFPVISELSRTVASLGIRNRATLVGNICSAVPCMDSGPLLVAYDALIMTVGPKGERSVPAEKWFIGSRKTAIEKGEIVIGISISSPGKHGSCFVKLGRYEGEDLAQVNLIILALKNYIFKVSFGSVAPVPVRAKKIEQLINGKVITTSLIEEACKLIEKEISPITDIRATKEYRMHMAKIMFERGLNAAVSRLNGSGPEYGKNLL
ncbi:MAG: xanthine dehydrogenase family protein subunit M [Ignavibacteriaceae bacterium]|nr:xanthine dehydrogenase family protein subunit M [Ignavibacteriaceae bacterium]